MASTRSSLVIIPKTSEAPVFSVGCQFDTNRIVFRIVEQPVRHITEAEAIMAGFGGDMPIHEFGWKWERDYPQHDLGTADAWFILLEPKP
jgi:hypothetical protein